MNKITSSAHGGHGTSSSSGLSSGQLDNKWMRLEVTPVVEGIFDVGPWQGGKVESSAKVLTLRGHVQTLLGSNRVCFGIFPLEVGHFYWARQRNAGIKDCWEKEN